jgi:hypothetical protein
VPQDAEHGVVPAITEDQVPSTKEPAPHTLILQDAGGEVLGVTNHGAFHSIYFFDPSGRRIGRACPGPEEEAIVRKLDAVKWEMLEEWSKTKRAQARGVPAREGIQAEGLTGRCVSPRRKTPGRREDRRLRRLSPAAA